MEEEHKTRDLEQTDGEGRRNTMMETLKQKYQGNNRRKRLHLSITAKIVLFEGSLVKIGKSSKPSENAPRMSKLLPKVRRSRWVVLTPSSLSYYRSESDAHSSQGLLGTLPLSGATLQVPLHQEYSLTSTSAAHAPPPLQTASSCMYPGCTALFGVFHRRRFCKSCGRSMCEEHCHQRVSIPEYGFRQPVRVCETCVKRLGNTSARDSETESSEKGVREKLGKNQFALCNYEKVLILQASDEKMAVRWVSAIRSAIYSANETRLNQDGSFAPLASPSPLGSTEDRSQTGVAALESTPKHSYYNLVRIPSPPPPPPPPPPSPSTADDHNNNDMEPLNHHLPPPPPPPSSSPASSNTRKRSVSQISSQDLSEFIARRVSEGIPLADVARYSSPVRSVLQLRVSSDSNRISDDNTYTTVRARAMGTSSVNVKSTSRWTLATNEQGMLELRPSVAFSEEEDVGDELISRLSSVVGVNVTTPMQPQREHEEIKQEIEQKREKYQRIADEHSAKYRLPSVLESYSRKKSENRSFGPKKLKDLINAFDSQDLGSTNVRGSGVVGASAGDSSLSGEESSDTNASTTSSYRPVTRRTGIERGGVKNRMESLISGFNSVAETAPIPLPTVSTKNAKSDPLPPTPAPTKAKETETTAIVDEFVPKRLVNLRDDGKIPRLNEDDLPLEQWLTYNKAVKSVWASNLKDIRIQAYLDWVGDNTQYLHDQRRLEEMLANKGQEDMPTISEDELEEYMYYQRFSALFELVDDNDVELEQSIVSAPLVLREMLREMHIRQEMDEFEYLQPYEELLEMKKQSAQLRQTQRLPNKDLISEELLKSTTELMKTQTIRRSVAERTRARVQEKSSHRLDALEEEAYCSLLLRDGYGMEVIEEEMERMMEGEPVEELLVNPVQLEEEVKRLYLEKWRSQLIGSDSSDAEEEEEEQEFSVDSGDCDTDDEF